MVNFCCKPIQLFPVQQFIGHTDIPEHRIHIGIRRMFINIAHNIRYEIVFALFSIQIDRSLFLECPIVLIAKNSDKFGDRGF